MEIDINNIELRSDKETYYLYFNEKSYRINKYFFQIFDSCKRNNTLDEDKLDVDFTNELDYTQECFVKKEFYSFIKELKEKKVTDKKYIKLKIPLLKKDLNKKYSGVFKNLFNKRVKIFLLLLIFITHCLFLFFHPSLLPHFTSTLNYIVFLGIILVIFFIHEIGHSAAVLFFRQDPEEIGFGFYYIFPVFYSNISSVWSLPKQQRLVVNMGGIYFQGIVNTFLIFMSLVFPEAEIIRNLVTVNILVMIYSLIPFLRNDGYWMYADFFNIENLMFKADRIFILKRKELSIPLIIFSVANWIFKLYLIYMMGLRIYKLLSVQFVDYHIKEYFLFFIKLSISLLGIVLLSIHLFKLVTGNVKKNDGF